MASTLLAAVAVVPVGRGRAAMVQRRGAPTERQDSSSAAGQQDRTAAAQQQRSSSATFGREGHAVVVHRAHVKLKWPRLLCRTAAVAWPLLRLAASGSTPLHLPATRTHTWHRRNTRTHTRPSWQPQRPQRARQRSHAMGTRGPSSTSTSTPTAPTGPFSSRPPKARTQRSPTRALERVCARMPRLTATGREKSSVAGGPQCRRQPHAARRPDR